MDILAMKIREIAMFFHIRGGGGVRARWGELYRGRGIARCLFILAVSPYTIPYARPLRCLYVPCEGDISQRVYLFAMCRDISEKFRTLASRASAPRARHPGARAPFVSDRLFSDTPTKNTLHVKTSAPALPPSPRPQHHHHHPPYGYS